MYVVTFYSFKGGVGRSMALVNVAVDLVQRGRRVLMVDFDLEAPGLDTFNFPHAEPGTPGLADYVTAYLTTGRAPGVDDYISKLHETNDGNGCLWLMPSGSPDGYARQFASIDWNDLYERRDGYLMFEDMKAQWATSIDPHYVLIDSRTGHTDVGGICTRHLPDAVVVLFFPNAQNLRGLRHVVSNIRSEAKSPRNKNIALHYVMSNVPDLDDEDRILEKLLSDFKKTLELPDDPLLVHHYPSLSLLNQAIFTRDRRRSRLSQEYGNIAASIIKGNTEDRDGAMAYIHSVTQDHRLPQHLPEEQLTEIDSHIAQIENMHSTDGEVLFHLARWHSDDERREALLTKAIEAGHRMPADYLPFAHLRRAVVRHRQGNRTAAKNDAMQVLMLGAPERTSRMAISLISKTDLKKLLSRTKNQLLSPGMQLEAASNRLNWTRDDLKVAYDVTKRLVVDGALAKKQRETAREQLILACIGRGKFAEAIDIVRQQQTDVHEMDIQEAFNFGMALWAQTGTITRKPFVQVTECDAAESRLVRGPNYLQCMSIAYWATGDPGRAETYALDAIRRIRGQRRSDISCWRYRRASVEDFVADTEAILRMVRGCRVVPAFIGRGD